VKCFPKLSSSKEHSFWPEIDALIGLDHRCIVPFFGFVLQVPPNGPQIATHFMAGGSLKDVLAPPP
jgi:hypothetical protein